MARPSALILHATGTNRDRDLALALDLAGADAHIAPMADVLGGSVRLRDHQLLLLPGGFSYGDDLGAGRLWALDLQHGLRDALEAFVAAGRPVLGICNGFQALVKAGLLPGPAAAAGASEGAAGAFAPQSASLARNRGGRFECRWVRLATDPRCRSPWLDGVHGVAIRCPVAHGEGRFVADDDVLDALDAGGQLALRYVDDDGGAAPGYPHNPNGSARAIAGICNAAGNVLGLMPHPENHVLPTQSPRRHGASAGQIAHADRVPSGLPLFLAGVRYAANA